MKDDDWDLIIKVHVKGAYKVCRGPMDIKVVYLTMCSVLERHGPIFGNRSMAGSLIRRQRQVYLATSGKPITLVSFHV